MRNVGVLLLLLLLPEGGLGSPMGEANDDDVGVTTGGGDVVISCPRCRLGSVSPS